MVAEAGPDVRIWPLTCSFAVTVVLVSETHAVATRPGRHLAYTGSRTSTL
jgi:hypothetical protein